MNQILLTFYLFFAVYIKDDNGFYIWSTPATDFLYIKTNLKIAEANIVDVSRRLLLKIKNPSSLINIAQLQPGNYILNVKTYEGEKSIKFTKK